MLGLGDRRLWQCGAKGHPGVEKLLAGRVRKGDEGACPLHGQGRGGVKARVIMRLQTIRKSQRVEQGEHALDIAVEVVGEIGRNLHQPLLDLCPLQRSRVPDEIDRKGQGRNNQRQGHQEQQHAHGSRAAPARQHPLPKASESGRKPGAGHGHASHAVAGRPVRAFALIPKNRA